MFGGDCDEEGRSENDHCNALRYLLATRARAVKADKLAGL